MPGGAHLDQSVYWRRRALVVSVPLLVLLAIYLIVVVRPDGDEPAATGDEPATAGDTSSTVPESTTTSTTTTIPVPASDRELELIETIGGELSSKSVVSSDHGYVIAQNMMYRHTISVFDRNHELVKTIPDEIEPAEFGLDYEPGVTLKGAPVEAAFLPDGSAAYVSNYHMYGGGFGPEPSDGCPKMSTDNSYVYRIDMESLEITDVIEVGTVPKFVAVSPDGRHVVVTNWCSYDISVIDVEQGVEIARLDAGRYPRGVAFSPDSAHVYVGVMGGDTILKIDMETLETVSSFAVAYRPRHLVMSPDGRYLYASRQNADDIVKIDVATETIVGSASTGSAPRSMDLSATGDAMYVANYHSNTLSKVLTEDMTEVQELPTGHHPIGLTVDDDTHQVWVANYSGTLMVFEDKPVAATASP